MRLLALICLIAVLGAACAAEPEVVTTASEPATDTDEPAEQPQGDDSAVTSEPGAPESPNVPEPKPEIPPDLGPDVVEVPEAQGWQASPLAIHVPDASEIGTDWIVDNGRVTEYEAAQPNDELEACGLTEPPTLDGVEVTYSTPGEHDKTVEFIVNRGTVADGQSFLDVFRGMADCDTDTLGFAAEAIDITTDTITSDVAGADDAIVTRFVGQPGAQKIDFSFVVVRYGELLLAMSSGDIFGESTADGLSVDQMLEIIERAADRG